ncbi:MAG: hypothetical protein IH624_13420 [Phycisphaerae bacterium]|nr:hypothetical protein [Phycisphaerae bacterium]
MQKQTALILALLIALAAPACAQPQIFTDFFNATAHIIDNDILDDAHTIEVALAAGSSGLIDLKAILISRWVTYEDKWNIVVQQGWAGMLRTAAIKDGFANVPPIYSGVPNGTTFDQRIPESLRIEDTVPFNTPAGRKIVEEALKCTPANPLVVIVGGRATCVADAYLINPAIADNVIVAEYLDYVGGDGRLPGYNIHQDKWAANIVLKNFRVLGAFSNRIYDYAPEVFLDAASDADRTKMPGTHLKEVMCLKSHPLLTKEHADGDGHAHALLQAGFKLVKSYETWSYDRWENGNAYLKRDPNGRIVKIGHYTSRDAVTAAWWNIFNAPGAFSDTVRTIEVTLFDGPDYKGSYKENGPHFRTGVNYERSIPQGAYTKDDLWSFYSIADKTISSMRVPAGLKITLFEGENFNGPSATYTKDTPNLGPLNNAASSLKIEQENSQENGQISKSPPAKPSPPRTAS